MWCNLPHLKPLHLLNNVSSSVTVSQAMSAQANGDALTLMVASDTKHMAAIEHFIGQKIPRKKLDSFDYKYTALFEEGKKGGANIGRSTGGRVSGGYSFGSGGKKKGGRRRRK